MLLNGLETLGLSQGEISVYSAVLNIGSSTINKIHEATGFERRAIYDILNKLIEKGLISYTLEKGKRTYQCTNPNKLMSETNKKIDALKEFEKEIPDIRKLYESSKPKIRSEIYRGIEGLKAIFEDMLNYKENYFIGGGWYIVQELPFFWPHYNKKRIELGVKWFNLVRQEFQKKGVPKEKLIFVKYLPKELSGYPAVIFIYGDKIVNVLWDKEFYGFMTECKEIAENYKKYHKYLWDNVAKTVK